MNFDEKLNELKSKGLDRHVKLRDESLINFSSNDYLGLSHHEDVRMAAVQALAKWGLGGTSSRLLAGTTPEHQSLEEELAYFTGHQRTIVYSSGYHTNTGVIPAITEAGDLILFDRLCHASILDGIQLSKARFSSFDHNDCNHLEELLRERRSRHKRALIVTEGIFSMDGDFSRIREIVRVAKTHDAAVYVDEAHSLGVIGPDGKGWADDQRVLSDIDFFVGTLSKTLGSQGGFVSCSNDAAQWLSSTSRSFLFTTALAPVCAAGARAALRLSQRMDDRRRSLAHVAGHLRKSLQEMGYDCLTGASQILPVWTGDVESTQRLSSHLLTKGFFVPSIRPPTVAAGEGRVRLSLTFDVLNQVDRLLDAFRSYAERPQRKQNPIVKS